MNDKRHFRFSALFAFTALLLNLSVISYAWSQENAAQAISSWDTPHAAELAQAGVIPVQTVRVGDAVFHLSPPYTYKASRQIAVAWISACNQKSVRAFYRSNSHCCWRMLDAITPDHLGKGFHEYDKNAPIDVTVAWLRSADKVAELFPWKLPQQAKASQEELAQQLLELLTIDRDQGLKSGQVVKGDDYYVTSEYASWIPMRPQPFSIVKRSIKTPTGADVPDPEQTLLPPEAQLPDFAKELASVKFLNPEYARFMRNKGEMTGRVFQSRDGKIRYYFVEDSEQRVFLSYVELADSPVCPLGVRTQYLDAHGMDAPLIDYGFQIPEAYGGSKQSRYQVNWRLVRSLPIIRYYYAAKGQPIPQP